MSTDPARTPADWVASALQRLASGSPFPDLLEELLELVVDAAGAIGGGVELRGFGAVSVGDFDASRAANGRSIVSHLVELDEAVVGSLTVKLGESVAPTDDRLGAVLDLGAGFVATAWSHAQALVRERAERQEEQGLVRAGQALALTTRLGDVLPVILEELRAVVPYDTASVQELRGDKVVIVGGAGINLAVFFGFAFSVDGPGTPNHEVIRGAAPVIVPDILGDHPYWNFPHPEHEMSGVRCWMGVPLMFGDECVGMLTLDKREPDFYTERHGRLAQAFASQAAIALENTHAFERAQHEVEVRRDAEERLQDANQALHMRMAEVEALQDHLREQSVRDPLTGVFNRRYLMETLDRELPRARRSNSPLVVAVVDVDHFKSVNDELGHEAGDRVLAQVAKCLAAGVRDEDVVCRYGGEEFVVVLPGATLDVARERADRWRDELRSMPLPEGLDGRAITISVGLSSFPPDGATGEELIRAADDAMYAAKRLGRDRVEAANV